MVSQLLLRSQLNLVNFIIKLVMMSQIKDTKFFVREHNRSGNVKMLRFLLGFNIFSSCPSLNKTILIFCNIKSKVCRLERCP